VCSDETLKILKSKHSQTFGEIEPTVLYSRNVDVDSINLEKYMAIPEPEKVYKTTYSCKDAKIWGDSLKIPESVGIKVGTQMMLTANLDVEEGYANGSRCMVTGIAEDGPIVVFKDGSQLIIPMHTYADEGYENGVCSVSTLPLKLAYALTIHKSQSMTLDAAAIDIGPSIFAPGQAYTALSRVRDLSSVRIINVSKKSFRVHDHVLQFYGKF
jgi:ATP-dependent exoDNAse (exonuclease V) alpha subunit